MSLAQDPHLRGGHLVHFGRTPGARPAHPAVGISQPRAHCQEAEHRSSSFTLFLFFQLLGFIQTPQTLGGKAGGPGGKEAA